MKILGGPLQQAVDSFEKEKQHDKKYVDDFIMNRVAPSLCTFMHIQVDPSHIKWDPICGHFNYEPHPIARLRFYPDDTSLT
jgi:hypothetical protein